MSLANIKVNPVSLLLNIVNLVLDSAVRAAAALRPPRRVLAVLVLVSVRIVYA